MYTQMPGVHLPQVHKHTTSSVYKSKRHTHISTDYADLNALKITSHVITHTHTYVCQHIDAYMDLIILQTETQT